MPRSSPPTTAKTTTVVSPTSTPTHKNDVNDNDNAMADPHLQLPKPSSLLLKRSAGQQHHKAPTNLTIFTPSYANGTDATSIRSAPLRPRSKQNGNSNNTANNLLQQRHQSNTQHRIIKPNTVKKHQQRPPATAAPWQRQGAPQTEFPSPPIVPSQQRCPPPYLRTATFPKTPMTTANHQPPQQQHHHQQVPATAAVVMPPRTNISKKQQFLQPFEMLYDNIEQSRQLKTTLDDQIRRSSSLIQTLQSSSTMVEALVRRHVRDAMQQQLQGYSHRVEWLEKRMLKSNRRHQQRSRQSSSSINESVGEQDHQDDRNMTVSPPPSSTTTSSNGNNQQMGHVLSELLDRLDRLETKIDSRH